MTGHTQPADGPAPAAYDRRRPAIVSQIAAQGDEIGLHPSYATSDQPLLLADEKSRLEALTGEPTAGVRFHYLRHRTHETLPLLDQLGFRYDTSQGFAEAPGLRAGFSLPYRPYDVAADRPLELTELPLAIMDATLAERRYLGLDADAGLQRSVRVLEQVAAARGTVAVLWHVDRFDRVYGRGWDRAYAAALAVGGRSRRAAGHRRRGYAASVNRTRRRRPLLTTCSIASTAAGMNWVPEQRRSSCSASSGDMPLR